MLDHDTDSYYKISGAFVDGKPTGGLTRDHILDNITLYWLTGTGASAARSYWESGQAQAKAHAAGQTPPEATLPAGFTSSRTRSSGRRAAGSSRATRTSSTSTRPTRAATSPPGRSRSCSARRCAPHSGRSVERPSTHLSKRPSRTCDTTRGGRHERHRPDQHRDHAVPGRDPGRPDRRPAPSESSRRAGRARSSSTTRPRVSSLAPAAGARALLGWTDYDFGRSRGEAQRPAAVHRTEIDGVQIHFIHVRSEHDNALPLIITHGWPGSIIEMLGRDRAAVRSDGARRRRPTRRSTS